MRMSKSKDLNLQPEIQLLKGALEQYSPTGSTEKMGEYLVNWAIHHGIEAKLDSGMAVINPKAQLLLMLGHMDTVSGELPVEFNEKRRMLTGRGAADAKGPLCAAMAALSKLPGLWDKISIVAAPDEEGASDIAKLIRDEWRERSCIILEPSTWQGITLSYMGRLNIECSLSCPPSHPGHLKPFATEELFKTWNSLASENIVRLRNIQGSETKATMTLDIRFRDASPEDILSEISDEIEYRLIEQTLPYTANKNTKLTRAFLRAVREVGGTPVFKKKTGTSDMNVLGERWKNAPMLAYGPGDGRLGHTDSEEINIEEYLKGIMVLERALAHIFE